MCDDITLVEAADALGLEVEAACRLFAPGSGPYRLRDVLAIKIMTCLRMLSPELALRIGCTAAADARANGAKPRLFVVSWGGREPACGWLNSAVPRDLTRAVLVIPADTWLQQLTDCIANHRAGAAHQPKERNHDAVTSTD